MASANVMSTPQNPVMPKSHVGFDSITTQIERKLLKRGFQFNVICVGMLVLWFLRNSGHTDSQCRPNRAREINSDKHHIRIAPYRLQRPPYPFRSSTIDDRDSSRLAW